MESYEYGVLRHHSLALPVVLVIVFGHNGLIEVLAREREDGRREPRHRAHGRACLFLSESKLREAACGSGFLDASQQPLAIARGALRGARKDRQTQTDFESGATCIRSRSAAAVRDTYAKTPEASLAVAVEGPDDAQPSMPSPDAIDATPTSKKVSKRE